MNRQSELYRKAGEAFAPALARLARAMERDSEKADDLEQEMHAALWASFARFEEQCALKTWVYRVAHNVAADHVAKAARGPKRVPLDQIGELPSPTNPEQDAGRSMVMDQVQALILQLPFPDAQVMALWLEGESTRLIAEITGLSTSAVGVRVHRLKQLLAAHFQDPSTKRDQS